LRFGSVVIFSTLDMMEIAINRFCSRSGKPVSNDSLTQYRGYTVGFCNPNCRDDFKNNIKGNPRDSNYFDVIN
tara:strand:- start:286 stop:504 length:219 start_codon:yes stop_codon:yes gene_type:complete